MKIGLVVNLAHDWSDWLKFFFFLSYVFFSPINICQFCPTREIYFLLSHFFYKTNREFFYIKIIQLKMTTFYISYVNVISYFIDELWNKRYVWFGEVKAMLRGCLKPWLSPFYCFHHCCCCGYHYSTHHHCHCHSHHHSTTIIATTIVNVVTTISPLLSPSLSLYYVVFILVITVVVTISPHHHP